MASAAENALSFSCYLALKTESCENLRTDLETQSHEFINKLMIDFYDR